LSLNGLKPLILNGRIAFGKEPYLTNDVLHDKKVSDKLWIKKHKIKSFAGYPLILGDNLTGLLTVFSENEIRPHTHETLSLVADSLAQGIGRLQVKEALTNSEQQYQTIFSTLTEGIVLQGTRGEILAANSSAQKILQSNFAEMKNNSMNRNNWTNYIHEDGSPFLAKDFPFAQALKTKEAQKNIIIGIIKNYQTTWLLTNSIPLKDSKGQAYAVASSFQDITQQKKLEKQKDEFISIASHELKTPLTTIKSFTEILKMQFQKEEKAQYYLGKMNREIDRLTGLVNELLDVSKIQSGGLTLSKDLIEINEFLKEFIEDIQAAYPNHKIIAQSIIKQYIAFDRHRIYEVLTNLVSNAIKYSPKSDKVILSTEERADKIIFKVKDFGIGITKRDKKRIFDPFFQAQTTIRQSYSGLGLGLHIAKEIVLKHGGEIGVTSKKGIGSIFRFSLPLQTNLKT
jgi:two-component system, OmpR family, phosphate regulon sensor histidine kinase PhoR